MSPKRIAKDIWHTLKLVRGMRNNPNLGPELRQSATFRFVTRFVPYRFLRHYIYPLFAGRGSQPYDAKAFFESYHKSAEGGELSDGTTVSPAYDAAFARYHYNATENAIIEALTTQGTAAGCSVLDIGSGAGHWVDFYLDVFRATHVTAAELAETAAAALRERYAGNGDVRVFQGDVSEPDLELGRRFDIINAVGVMFHLVRDEQWKRAIANFARHLNEGGVIVVGGQFGWVTRNVQFHSSDQFESWNALTAAREELTLVNKRIRSLRFWKTAAREAGLRVIARHKTKQAGYIYTPENNILLLGGRGE
ncbi:MAG: class I SAM-dependent methyltransferase [Candidatus Hydrogenedentes bacterium]|nr:class I SAM-dependent methyltransferase [Candidatus Hydrogenedentota bacterium]